MSDYIPNPDPRRDPRNYDAYYEPSGSKGLTLVVVFWWPLRWWPA